MRGKGALAKPTSRILAEDKPGRSDVTWTMLEDEKPEQILRVISGQGWGI